MFTYREVKDIVSGISGETTDYYSAGSGYYEMCNHTIKDGDEEVMLDVAFEVVRYKDDTDGHKYFGVYYFPEVECGEMIDQSEWDYTESCSIKELRALLNEIASYFPPERLEELYRESLVQEL